MGSAVIGLEHQPAVMPVQQIGRRVATDTDSIGSPAARWGGFILPVPSTCHPSRRLRVAPIRHLAWIGTAAIIR